MAKRKIGLICSLTYYEMKLVVAVFSRIILDNELTAWLAQDAKKVGNQLAKFERIKNFLVKREPFSIENGYMTITLKVKRKVVMDKYIKEIDAMYLSVECPL